MSKEIESISTALFDKIRTRFDPITLGDEKAKATSDPSKARFFNFEYIQHGVDYGKLTISLIDETSLKIYFGQNITKDMDRDQRKEWYEFLRNVRQFAKRNLLTFDTRDINKSNLALQDVKQQAKIDDVSAASDLTQQMTTESKIYGNKKHSFTECGQRTRLRILHDSVIDDDVHGARSRHIDKIFVETALGERFLLPFKNLHGARAMGQHIDHGGEVHDERGQHICELVKEMSAMTNFVRGTKSRQFEDQDTADMTRAAVHHYDQIKRILRLMRGARGYRSYFESYSPQTAVEENIDVVALRERFAKKIYNNKFDEALPYVYRAHQQYKEQLGEYGAALDEWANEVTESTWLQPKPDDVERIQALRDLLKTPLLAGIDGVDAKAKLGDIIGDDDLYNEIETLGGATGQGPDADCRPLIKKWLMSHLPQLLRDLEIGKKNVDDASTNWAQPVSPGAAQGSEYGDARGGTGDNSHNMTY